MTKITVITSLFRCEDFLRSYLRCVKSVTNLSECEFLLLHNEPTKRELEIIDEEITNCPYIIHIIIPQRESLYATWNRGCKMAKGEFIAIWNVDDVRTSDSLELQSRALVNDPNAMYAYGIYTCVDSYGDMSGKVISEPDTKNNVIAKTHRHLGGCFPMWRKSVHDRIGYFDEQLKLVGDLDFQIRIGLRFPFVKVNEMLGYYLIDNPNRLSKNLKLQSIENNFVYRRYKLISLIDPLWYKVRGNMDLYNIVVLGKKSSLFDYVSIVSNYNSFGLYFYLMCKLPYCALRYFKHGVLKL